MAQLRIRPSSVVMVIAGAGFLAVTLTAAALVFPEAPFAASSNLSPVFDMRADALAKAAGTDEAARLDSIAETRRSIAQSPANPISWLRLAYLDSIAPEGFGSVGDRALAASYVVAPYGPDVTDWRLGFAFDQWDVISSENRQAAMDELRIASTHDSRRELLKRVVNPAGRLALSLTLGVMELEAATVHPVV